MRARNAGLARIMYNMQSRHGTLLKHDKKKMKNIIGISVVLQCCYSRLLRTWIAFIEIYERMKQDAKRHRNERRVMYLHLFIRQKCKINRITRRKSIA